MKEPEKLVDSDDGAAWCNVGSCLALLVTNDPAEAAAFVAAHRALHQVDQEDEEEEGQDG